MTTPSIEERLQHFGLNIEKPSDDFYQILRKIQVDYTEELKLLEPYTPHAILGASSDGSAVPFSIPRALVEAPGGGCYGFVSEGTVMRIKVQTPNGVQDGVKDERLFEGWRRLQ